MKKLKTLFSPRKLVVILIIVVGILTIPGLNAPAMSQTQAIVTMLCMDKKEGDIVISATVLSPGPDNIANYQVFTGEGNTLGEAVSNVSLSIGKEMGFAQCEVMALGENLCVDGIMQTLDFMTRTKKVGRNAYLVCFEGDIDDFSKSLSNLNKEKSLSLEKIMSFDKRYVLSKEGNIESFYKGYYSDISLGVMPKLKLSNTEEPNAIEVASSGQTSGSGQEESTSEEKKYFVNDGSISIFKKGAKVVDVNPDEMKKINFFVNNSQQGTIEVDDVTDSLYNHDKVILDIVKKKNKTKVSFDGNTPVFKSNIELIVTVEQVMDNSPEKNMLKRNNDFLTDEVIKKVKQKVISSMQDCTEFCKQNKTDIIEVYTTFYKHKNKQFKEYLDRVGKENYLDGIRFEYEVNVSNEY